MPLVYFDSSAFVKLLISEAGSQEAAALWNAADRALSSPLAYPEVRAALAAAGRADRLGQRDLAVAVATWERYWQAVSQVSVSAAVNRQAGQLTTEHVLRGADALHLASVIAVGAGGTIFAVWDQQLRSAARDRGIPVAPDDP